MQRIVYIIISLVSLIVSIILYINNLYEYTIIAATFTFGVIFLTIRYLWNNRDAESAYKSKVHNILKTYDSILIKSDELPDVTDKNIVEVSDIDGLIDAQIELKKPIYYKEYDAHVVFVLIDNDEACVTILKQDSNTSTPFESRLEEIKNMKSGVSTPNMDILDDLENTTIIKLNDDREFKISPIKKRENIFLIPTSCMIDKECISLVLKDNTTTKIDLATIEDLDSEYDEEDKLRRLSFITEDATYTLTSINPNKMKIIKTEILKRITKDKEKETEEEA